MNELEKRLECEDRGPVKPFSTDGRTHLIYCCAFCMTTIHVVITRKGRAYACPQCVQILSYFIAPQNRKTWGDKPKDTQFRPTNRVKEYLDKPWEEQDGNFGNDIVG